MTAVLLFAEHELNQREVRHTLHALAALRVEGQGPVNVTVLVPYLAHLPNALMFDIAAARGMSPSRAFGESQREAAAARGSARRVLQHALRGVREGGHVARGELVAVRDEVRDLAAEATARGASTALVVSSPHRLSHLLHRDLEHRLLHAGVAQVLRVRGAPPAAATATPPP